VAPTKEISEAENGTVPFKTSQKQKPPGGKKNNYSYSTAKSIPKMAVV
jgi:hypothetical protein